MNTTPRGNYFDLNAFASILKRLLFEEIICFSRKQIVFLKESVPSERQLTCLELKNWPRGYKINSCSTQLSMKFSLLINVKMPTIVGVFTFISMKNNIPGLSEPEKKSEFLDIFTLMSI